MKLYMIRHGQSMNNLSKCYTGWQQVELSPQGREEAQKVGMLLRHISFDRVYSSDLLRAIQTQQLALPNAQAQTTPLLREVDVGHLAGRPIADCYAQYPALLQKHDGFAPYGGESYAVFWERLREFLHQLERDPCEKVVAFCHAGTIRGMLRVILDADIAPGTTPCGNCGICVFSYTNGKWRLDTWNYTGTLE